MLSKNFQMQSKGYLCVRVDMVGTHNTWLSGSNLNDIILTERAINKTEAFQNFIAERGKVELVKSYLTNNIHVFN